MYSLQEKQEILIFHKNNGITKTIKQFGVTDTTIYRWTNPKISSYYKTARKRYDYRGWYIRHPTYMLVQNRKWAAANPEKNKEIHQEWYKRHKTLLKTNKNIRIIVDKFSIVEINKDIKMI